MVKEDILFLGGISSPTLTKWDFPSAERIAPLQHM